MNRRLLLQFFIFLTLQATVYGGIKNNCRIVDSSGKVFVGRVKKYDILKVQEKVTIQIDSSTVLSFGPSEVRRMEYFRRRDTLRYEPIEDQGKKLLASLQHDGIFLKIYEVFFPGRKVYGSKLIAYKDGVNIYQGKSEPFNIWMARIFSDYPLLSQMSTNNQIDMSLGFEKELILKEYESWRINNADAKSGDTTVVLKAIFDANRLYNSRRYFHLCRVLFWGILPLTFVSTMISLVIAIVEPKFSNLGLPSNSSTESQLYLKAYRLRAHSLKALACIKGIYLS